MGGGRRVQGPGRVHCLGRSRGRSREGTKGMSLVWYRSKRERGIKAVCGRGKIM